MGAFAVASALILAGLGRREGGHPGDALGRDPDGLRGHGPDRDGGEDRRDQPVHDDRGPVLVAEDDHRPDRSGDRAGVGLQQHGGGRAAGVPAERARAGREARRAATRWPSPRRSWSAATSSTSRPCRPSAPCASRRRRRRPTAGSCSTGSSRGGCRCPSSARWDATWSSGVGERPGRDTMRGSLPGRADDAQDPDRRPRRGPAADGRQRGACRKSGELQAEGRTLVSLMRGQPDTPTPPHIVEAATKALRDGRTGYPDNQGEPAPAPGGRREGPPRAGDRIRPRPRDPDHRRRDPGRLRRAGARWLGPGAACSGPTRSTTPMAGRSPCGAAGRRPSPRRSATAGSPSTAPAASEPGAPPAEHPPAQHALEPGRHGADAGGAPRGDGVRRGHELAVLSDEIYEALVYDGRRHVSPASVSDDARGRTVLINSLSKTYAMTGWRVGYCAGPAEVIGAMFLVLQQSSRGPATFVQDAAACALSSDQECVRRMAAEYQGRRDRVVERLRGIPGVEPLVPEGGLFVMVDVRGLGRPSDEVRRFLLREAGRGRHPRRGLRTRGRGDLARLVRRRGRDAGARPGAAPRRAVEARGGRATRGTGMTVFAAARDRRGPGDGRPPVGTARGAGPIAQHEGVRADRISRALYSTDASVYQIVPADGRLPRDGRRRGRDRPAPARGTGADHGPGGRHVAGRAVDRAGRDPRLLEAPQPRARDQPRGALGAGRAGVRARRPEPRPQAARPAVRPRHLDLEPRDDRRDGRQQLVRGAVGPVRQDDRPCARADGRPGRRQRRRAGAALGCRSWRRSVRSDDLEGACYRDDPPAGRRARRGDRPPLPQDPPPRRRVQPRRLRARARRTASTSPACSSARRGRSA